ncbi:MAG TPA: hypothetical protein VFK78_02295 [Gemmatimonadales bacterium]|nr:hypothetical protein [Gemmatimonadales bacterium]
MRFKSGVLTLAVGALAWVGAACSSSEAPAGTTTPPDTLGSLSTLVGAESSFVSPVYTSFLASIGGVAFAAAPPIVHAAPFLKPWQAIVTAPGLLAGRSPVSHGAISAALPPRPSMTAASVVPDSVLGKTFEWDTATNTYVKTTRAGAPANGVRFILYALVNDTVAEPVSEIGRLDVFDQSTSAAAKVRFLVAGPGGAPVYYDATTSYAHSGGTDSTVAVSGSGFVSNGLTASELRKVTFSALLDEGLFSDTAVSVKIGVNFSLNQPASNYTSLVTEAVNPRDTTVSYDLRLTDPAGSVRLALLEVENADGRLTTVKLYTNGALFATLLASGSTSIWTDADGNLLSADDIAIVTTAFDHLLTGVNLINAFLQPALGVLGF